LVVPRLTPVSTRNPYNVRTIRSDSSFGSTFDHLDFDQLV
jgi:hypothetical protein